MRLLRICDPPRDQIQGYSVACKVEVFPANTLIPYTAVSYMWGSAIETADVLINGNPFPVTLNLLSLLEELTAAVLGDAWIRTELMTTVLRRSQILDSQDSIWYHVSTAMFVRIFAHTEYQQSGLVTIDLKLSYNANSVLNIQHFFAHDVIINTPCFQHVSKRSVDL
jgi:hypothetical protein